MEPIFGNQEQSQAITLDSGPLLIIAGAGTGKTFVITSKIFHLIETKKYKPGEILALTFTEKASNEMMERIDLMLPLGYETLWIKTFHGFCESVLREYGLEIGLPTDYKILSTPELWFFCKNHLFDFPLDTLRPLGNPTKCLNALIDHFSRLKDEDISPSKYREYAENKKNENDSDEYKKEKELAGCYEVYQKLMIEQGYLDFGDLAFYTLRLFEQRPHILKTYQNRFKHILVDEFQDTNYAQNKLVELLAHTHQNITVVGDDDQSIYKWRGASITNILKFEKMFPECKKIVLNKNYRSSQNILSLSHSIIQNNNPNRLEIQENIDKKLRAVQENENLPIDIIHTENLSKEVETVLREIEKLHNEKSIPYNDCAILVRANNHAKPFIDECKKNGLPYHSASNQGFFSREEIKDLMAFIKIMSNVSDDIAFFRILSMPLWNISMEEILLWVQQAKLKSIPLFFFLKNLKENPDLFKKNVSIKTVHDLLTELLEQTRRDLPSQIIGLFLKKSEYLKNITLLETSEAYEKTQYIAQFSKIILKFEANNQQKTMLSLAEYLRLLEESGENQSFGVQEDYIDIDRIHILTVHASKGLEFPYVFLVNLVNERFPAKQRNEPFEIPESLIPETLPKENTHFEEERRLFYVGCTRTKKKLFLSYSDFYEGKKEWKKSIFVTETENSGCLLHEISEKRHCEKEFSEIHHDSTRKHESISPHRNHAGIIVAPEIFPIAGIEKKNIKNFKTTNDVLMLTSKIFLRKLSYSQIDTFQICPHKYKLNYLWKVPTPLNHALSFGSSIHNTLRDFYQILKKNPTLAKKHDLKECYEKNWLSQGYLNKTHEQKRKSKGWILLEEYYEIHKTCWTIPIYLERNFSFLIGKYMINGRIDRIDRLKDGSFEVIDYKTGALKKQNEVDKDMQLSLYALACKKAFNIPARQLSLYFLEENKKISTIRTNEQIEETEKTLEKLASSMETSDFKATPSFMCQFCDYKLLCYAV
ncbi:ATP-dependent helicase [Candidatus Peregrinibacteria bacterium]|nr:ATP-dependent helicase [Candidatus Peregrinibacteria bacterium]